MQIREPDCLRGYTENKKPRRKAGLLICQYGVSLAAGQQSGRDLAVDADQGIELLGARVAHHHDCLVHDEQAEVGDVLADVPRQRVVAVGGIAEKYRPKLAIVKQRVVKLRSMGVPRIMNCLKLRGGLKKQVCFKVARACCLS